MIFTTSELSFMNRLHHDDWAVGVRRITKPLDIVPDLAADSTRKSPHRFFVPMHYEKNYAYPLLVWLHGPGGSETEIAHVMPHISLRNYVGVSPRGTVKNTNASRVSQHSYTWDQSTSSVESALEDVLECVESAKHQFNVADDRVFLVGNEMGGTMALRLALMSPQYFGGAISLGGALPVTNQPFSGIERARSMPIMMAHCRDSLSYNTDAVCSDLRLLHSAGMSVCLRQYPCEQEVTTKMLADVNEWMMERVTGSPSTNCEIDDPTHLRLEDHN